jgi:hypothetical protein
MTNPYIAALRVSASSDQRWGFFRELRRYEVAAKGFREAGFIGLAGLFDGYAEQTRLEIEALAKVDQRIAALDAKLCGACEDDPDATASAIAFGGPLPVRTAGAA